MNTSVLLETNNGQMYVLEGPGDPRDQNDPLTLNVAFPGGHQQYITCFQEAAKQRKQ